MEPRLKKPQHVSSHHRRCRSDTWICVFGYTRDTVTQSKFHAFIETGPFRGFGATCVEIWPSHYHPVAFYN